MTDQELIQRLLEKSVGEFTPDEIEAVRARWTQSPELRQALVDHLRLESLLTGSLGSKRLDVDTILQSALRRQSRDQSKHQYWLWIAGFCLLAIGGVIGVTLFVARRTPAELVAKNVFLPEQQAADSVPQQIDLSPEASGDLKQKPAETMVVQDSSPTPSTEQLAAPETVVKPPSDPALAHVAPNEPWSHAFSRDVAPWTEDSPHWTENFKAAGHDELTDAEARRWFTHVEGQALNWSTDPIGNPTRRIARFDGFAKLRAPWPQDAILRLTPFDVADLTLYFWRGPTGIAFRLYTRREPHLWAAFEISRENSSPKPTRWGLLTTDNGSYNRSTPGMFDIRQQNDQLVLARGGIVLMSAPFQGPPVEVYLEGQFRLRGVSMHRSAPFHSAPQNRHPVIVSGPASILPWAISPETPATFKLNDDGSVTLTVDSPQKLGAICLPFGGNLSLISSSSAMGLFEVIVRVDSADPGTGIYLGDRDGRPVHQLGFFRDATTQQITFGTLRPGQTHTDLNFKLQDYPPPYLSKFGWLKLTAGLGTLQIQTSGDGHHWGHVVENPARDWPGAVNSIGLYALPGPTARSIRVREIHVRELIGVTDLADPDLRRKAPLFAAAQLSNLSEWKHAALDVQPADTDTATWLTACAVAALSQGPPKQVGLELLNHLIAVGIKSDLTVAKKLELLSDACGLCDLFDETSAGVIGKWYEEIGWQLARAGDPDPLATTRPAWLWSPIWTTGRMRSQWEQLHSHEILQSVYRRDWQTAWRIAQSTSYWNLLPHPDLHPVERGEFLERHARWAKSVVADAAPQLDDGSSGILPAALRHPLMPVLNKEAYNMRADLQSALSGGSYEDACRILISLSPQDGTGLLPDIEDRELFVSLQTAVSIARKTHPDFSGLMSAKFEPLGMIRVKSAINRRDLVSLQAATLQFMGTDAARQAHSWLGDMALSAGQFDSAEQHFRRALVDASPVSTESLVPRILLSQALSGQLPQTEWSVGKTRLPDQSIDLNGQTISRETFVALIDQTIQQSQSKDILRMSPANPPIPFPRSAYQLELRSQFDGHPGTNPGRWEYRFGDPVGRQFATSSDAQRIYVSNRFQVNAYSAQTGQQVWAQGLGSEQGEAYAMPFAPMQPLLAGERLYVRRLTKAGAELACLNSATGQVIWNQRPFQSALTDPVCWNGKLFVLAVTRIDDDVSQVMAVWVDFKTGQQLAHRPLFRLQESPDRQFSGQLAMQGNIAVCTVAGTTAQFDSAGEIGWVRRHFIMRKPIDELYEDQRLSAPVFAGRHVIVTGPGVRAVACLDLESGRLVWEQPVTDLRGVIGVSPLRILIDTVSKLMALDTDTGQVAWNYAVDGRLEGLIMDGSHVIVTRRATFPNSRSKPLLVWLDLQSGAERAQTLVQIPDHDEIQIGPIFSAGDQWWSLVGQSWKEPQRQLQQFMVLANATPESFQDPTLKSWSPSLSAAKLAEIEAVVPGWFPVADYGDRITLHPEDIQGETFTLLSRLEPQQQLRFTHLVPSAVHQRQRLILRVGNRPGQKWLLTVLCDRQSLINHVIEDGGAEHGWRTVTVDLSGLAAKPHSLQLIQSTINNTPAEAIWKSAQVVEE